MSDLPVLLVAVPILGAVVPPLLARRHPKSGWPVAVVTLLVQTGVALYVALLVARFGPVTTVVGGYPAVVGIELVVDRLSAPFVVLVAVSSLGALAYTRRGGPRSATTYSLYLLLAAGLTGVCVTGDVFNLYVFLEISGLAAYALVAAAGTGRAAVASLRYLLVGTVGASLYLLGVGYLYVATGVLNMTALAAALPAVGYASPLVVASFALAFVGLAVKMALYPLHTWKPGAYATSAPGVAAVLSALVSTIAAYAFVRLLYGVYTVAFLDANPAVALALSAIAVASIVAGAVLALVQTDVRRLLAYSGVSQFGVVLAGVATATGAGLTGAVVHLVGHALMKGGAFLAAGLFAQAADAHTVDDYAGLSRRAPVTSAAFAVLALGLVGIPPTVGFFGKWYVAVGAVEGASWGVLAAVLLSTLLSLAYFARLLQRMYAQRGESTGAAAVAPGMVASVVAAAVVTVALGLASVGVAGFVEPFVAGVTP